MRIEEGAYWKTVFEIQDLIGERGDARATRARQNVEKLEQEMRELTRTE